MYESQFSEKTEEISPAELAEMPENQHAQDLIVNTQKEGYWRAYNQLQLNLANDTYSYETLDFNRFTMHLDLKDEGSICIIACHKANLLEPFELSLFGELICRNPDSTVMDVGASYGLYTLTAADLARFGIVDRVIAIEPDRRAFAKLSESIKANEFDDVIYALNKAASDSNEQQVGLFVNAGGSLDNRTHNPGNIQVGEQYSVETVTIDAIVNELKTDGNTPKRLIVKMDIQGNEPRAIRGMSQMLQEYNSVALLFEYMPAMMKEAGFDPEEFAHELFEIGFDQVVNINEMEKTIEPLPDVDNLIRVIEQCRTRANNDPRRYTNLLCLRSMNGPGGLEPDRETTSAVEADIPLQADIPAVDHTGGNGKTAEDVFQVRYLKFLNGEDLVLPERIHILLACMMKSGSTFLYSIFKCLPGIQGTNLVPDYERREQELSLERLLTHADKNFISKNHVRFSKYTENLIDNFKLKPIVLVRNLFDVVISLDDHLFKQNKAMPMAYFDEQILNLGSKERYHAIIDLALPWFFNFYASWYDYPNKALVTYEELVHDPVDIVWRLAQAFKLPYGKEDITQATAEAQALPTRRNKAVVGRGEQMLNGEQKEKIVRMASYYPELDFSTLGINSHRIQKD